MQWHEYDSPQPLPEKTTMREILRSMMRTPLSVLAGIWVSCWLGMIVLVGVNNPVCWIIALACACACVAVCALFVVGTLRPRLLIQLASWVLPRAQAVELISYDGKRFFTLARTVKHSANLHASVNWVAGVGQCVLLPQGLNSSHSDTTFIQFWLPLRKQERLAMILREDLPDFAQLDAISSREQRTRAIMHEYAQRIQGLES